MIVNTYKRLVGTGQKYYENEILAKLEDAFLVDYVYGVEIIHGNRELVEYTTISTLPGTSVCELGDLRLIMYDSTKPTEFRRVFLQFKNVSGARSNLINVPEKQNQLYGKNIDFIYKNTMNRDKTNAMNTMFVAIKGDDLVFGNRNGFPIPKTTMKSRKIDHYTTTVEEEYIPYIYCKYAKNLEAFLVEMKNMRVGEILNSTHSLYSTIMPMGKIDVYKIKDILSTEHSFHRTILIDVSILDNKD